MMGKKIERQKEKSEIILLRRRIETLENEVLSLKVGYHEILRILKKKKI